MVPRIIAQTTTETTGRGMSHPMIYMDEFAFRTPKQSKRILDSYYPNITPTGGKCIITSHTNNDDDLYAQLWRGANKLQDEYGNPAEVGLNGFRPKFVHWSQHPDRDEVWAKEERQRIGEERFRREHECEFIAFDETLIDGIKLITLQGTQPLVKHGQVRWYQKVQKGNTYMVSGSKFGYRRRLCGYTSV